MIELDTVIVSQIGQGNHMILHYCYNSWFPGGWLTLDYVNDICLFSFEYDDMLIYNNVKDTWKYF